MGLNLNSNNNRWSDLGLTLEKKKTPGASAFSLINWEELHSFHNRLTNVNDQCQTLTPRLGPSTPTHPQD